MLNLKQIENFKFRTTFPECLRNNSEIKYSQLVTTEINYLYLKLKLELNFKALVIFLNVGTI